MIHPGIASDSIDIDALLEDDGLQIELIRSTVRLARLSFGAAASSVFLYDPGHERLVLVASSGESEDTIIGLSIPSDSGIAGWVLQSGEAVLIDETSSDARFNRTFAEATGYVPSCIIAACLEAEGEPLGVVEVLDPTRRSGDEIQLMELTSELARHCSAGLRLLTLPPVTRRLHQDHSDQQALAQLVGQIGRSQSRAESVEALAGTLASLLGADRPSDGTAS